MDLYQLIDASQEPILKTHAWIQEAKDKGAGLPHALNLSSVSPEGQPSSRMVLLKRLSDEGLVFFTDYDGKKGQEIVNNNKAAINFWWAKTNKQIRIEGVCTKVSNKESDDYFHSRPRGSQISASVSLQSQEIESYDNLVKDSEELENKYLDKEIPRPKRWGGFLVKPSSIEFWIDQKNRLHKRELFKSDGSSWKKTLLSP